MTGFKSASYLYKQEDTQFKSVSFIHMNWFLNSSHVLVGDNSEGIGAKTVSN